MTVRVDGSLEGIDWAQAKADLAADDFDNGRSPGALRASFEHSQHVAIARDGDRVVGMARLLSDGVCNAYLLPSRMLIIAPPMPLLPCLATRSAARPRSRFSRPGVAR